jgi:hypothetical protein
MNTAAKATRNIAQAEVEAGSGDRSAKTGDVRVGSKPEELE